MLQNSASFNMVSLTFHVSLLSLHFSAPYKLGLVQNPLPAAFTNCPRIFLDLIQSFFWAFHSLVLIDFCLIAVLALFLYLCTWLSQLSWEWLEDWVYPTWVTSTGVQVVDCILLRLGLPPFPPLLHPWTFVLGLLLTIYLWVFKPSLLTWMFKI